MKKNQIKKLERKINNLDFLYKNGVGILMFNLFISAIPISLAIALSLNLIFTIVAGIYFAASMVSLATFASNIDCIDQKKLKLEDERNLLYSKEQSRKIVIEKTQEMDFKKEVKTNPNKNQNKLIYKIIKNKENAMSNKERSNKNERLIEVELSND